MVNHIIIQILITLISAENIRHCQSTISYGYYIWIICVFEKSPKKYFWAQWRHGQKLKSQSNLFFYFESSLKIVFFYLKEGALWSRSAANQIHFSFSSTRAYNPDRSSSEFSRWVSRWYEQIMFRWGSDEAIFEISDFLLANWFVEFWNF